MFIPCKCLRIQPVESSVHLACIVRRQCTRRARVAHGACELLASGECRVQAVPVHCLVTAGRAAAVLIGLDIIHANRTRFHEFIELTSSNICERLCRLNAAVGLLCICECSFGDVHNMSLVLDVCWVGLSRIRPGCNCIIPRRRKGWLANWH